MMRLCVAALVVLAFAVLQAEGTGSSLQEEAFVEGCRGSCRRRAAVQVLARALADEQGTAQYPDLTEENDKRALDKRPHDMYPDLTEENYRRALDNHMGDAEGELMDLVSALVKRRSGCHLQRVKNQGFTRVCPDGGK